MEIVAIVAFFASCLWLGGRVALGMHDLTAVLGTALAVFCGYVSADFMSGFAHWAGDRLGSERTPFLGKNFVTPFRQHHVDPKAICHHDFIETNGNNCIVFMPVLLALVVFMPGTPGIGFYAGTVLTSQALFILCTNQFHKWAHADVVPGWIQRLQRWGVILSPRHHAIHHATPHDKYYCITVGWMNPMLTKLRFFRGCEWIVAQVRPTFLNIEDR